MKLYMSFYSTCASEICASPEIYIVGFNRRFHLGITAHGRFVSGLVDDSTRKSAISVSSVGSTQRISSQDSSNT